jgi:hypothetical protein
MVSVTHLLLFASSRDISVLRIRGPAGLGEAVGIT